MIRATVKDIVFFAKQLPIHPCKVRDVDGSSAPFIIALKSNIANRMNSNFSFCKNTTQFQLLSNVLSAIYWIKFYSFN